MSDNNTSSRDPIFALIAEEQRLRLLAVAARKPADLAEFAGRPSSSNEADAEKLEVQAGMAYDEVADGIPSTLAGAIAKVTFFIEGVDDDLKTAIEQLIAAAASIEPEVIGLSEPDERKE